MASNSLHPDPQFTLDAARLEPGGDGGGRHSPRERRTRRIVAWLAVLALLIVGGLYWMWMRAVPVPPPSAQPAPASAPSPAAPPEPAIAHPVEKTPGLAASEIGPAPTPLPGLDQSDAVATDAIETMENGSTYLRLLAPPGIIRKIVATVDNLPRKSLDRRILPVKTVPGQFAVASTGNGISIADANARRYAAYVAAAEALDTERMVHFYVRLYPLFQQAYADLGYPGGYFNDRLIGVIDHLLGAPEPRSPVYLVQPKVVFEFADPALQDLSAGQKIMVRVGLANELRLKAKLRDLRRKLTGETAKP